MYDFDELTNAGCIINNNPGIFGKNCSVNNKVSFIIYASLVMWKKKL